MFSNHNFQNEVNIYQFIMHINGVCSILSTFLSTHVIIQHTPPKMKTYRYYLLNIVFWSALVDIHLGLLYTPMIQFPATGICNYGLLSVYDNFEFKQFQYLALIFLMSGFGIAVSSAFVYRLAAITQSTGKLHNTYNMAIMILFHLFYATPIFIPVTYACMYDPPAVLDEIKTRFPAIYEFSQQNSCLFISTTITPISSALYGSFAVTLILIIGVTYTILPIIIMKKLKNEKDKMSKTTLRLHKQLTYSLIAQSFLPTLTFILPLLVMLMLYLIDRLDNIGARVAASTFFVICSSHSSLNCLSMIIMTKPYREAVSRKLCCIKSNNNSTVIQVISQANPKYIQVE